MKLKKITNIVTLVTVALLVLATQSFAQLTNGLVAYWPMDNVVGCDNQTPDVINGYNLSVARGGSIANGLVLTNFNPNIYLTNDAVRGNSIYVDNGNGQNQFLTYRSVNTNDLVPITRSAPGSNTISFWIKTNPGHPPDNNDQRIWTESSYEKTFSAALDISPGSAGASGYEIFTRQTGVTDPYGNFSGGAHTTGTGTIADNTWHNVTLETVPDGIGTNSGNLMMFIDGTNDPSFVLAKPDGLWVNDTVGIFAFVRGDSPAGFLTNCFVDDFAEWNRALSTNEIMDYMANGITNISGGVSPLTISTFGADLHTVIAGSSVTLNWLVSSDATDISINNGVGDVFALSTCGAGSTNVTVNGTTTFTLTATRGASSVTQTITIQTVTGVAAGWNYIGGFDDNSLGALASQGNWQSLFSSPITAGYQAAQVLQTATGNHVLGLQGAPILSAGVMGSHSIGVGSSNTLFFRFYIDGSINDLDPVLQTIPDVDVNIGASGAVLFDLTSFTGANANNPEGTGPAVHIFRNTFGDGGPIDLTANWGALSTSGFSYVTSVDPNGLATNTIYNVWIDIYNNTNDPVADAAVYYSVTVQKGGDAGTIIPLFSNQISDLQTNTAETLDKAFIAATSTGDDSTNNVVRFDDFYVSSPTQGGAFNHTLPVPAGSFTLGAPSVPAGINITSVSKSGSSVTLNWTASPAGSYSFSVWSRSSLTGGSWTSIASGITGNTFTDTAATGSQNFYRVTSP